jgi:transposase
MDQELTLQRPRRREYSGEFKSSVLEQCRRPGASVAGVALGHGLNPNMVHRWLREERQRQLLAPGGGAFVPVSIPPVQAIEAERCEPALAAPASTPDRDPDPSIRIEIQRGGTRVSVQWPASAAQQCAVLLGEWLR